MSPSSSLPSSGGGGGGIDKLVADGTAGKLVDVVADAMLSPSLAY